MNEITSSNYSLTVFTTLENSTNSFFALDVSIRQASSANCYYISQGETDFHIQLLKRSAAFQFQIPNHVPSLSHCVAKGFRRALWVTCLTAFCVLHPLVQRCYTHKLAQLLKPSPPEHLLFAHRLIYSVVIVSLLLLSVFDSTNYFSKSCCPFL